MSLKSSLFMSVCLMGALSGLGQSNSLGLPPVPPKVLSALAEGEWERALADCPAGVSNPAVVRAIVGHCLLFLNRNDDSLRMFLSLCEGVGRAEWAEWTKAFANRFPSSETAAYLRGDALARSADWTNAIAEYGRALALRPAFAMALNARGIARLKVGDEDAIDDFEGACAARPDFADAQASLGVLRLRQGAVDSARACFTNALRLSQGFALAVNGEACSVYSSAKPNCLGPAFELFRKAAATPGVAPLACFNAEQVVLAECAALSNKASAATAGTTIAARDAITQMRQQNQDTMANIQQQIQASKSQIQDQIQNMRDQIQQQQQQVNQTIQQIKENEQGLGWSSAFGHITAQGGGVVAGGLGVLAALNPEVTGLAIAAAAVGGASAYASDVISSMKEQQQNTIQSLQGQFGRQLGSLMNQGGATTDGTIPPPLYIVRWPVNTTFGLALELADPGASERK